MRVLPGHDNKIIRPDKNSEKGFVLDEVQVSYE